MKDRTVVISLFIFILFSCSISNTLYNEGLKLEEVGMYNEANNRYYEALKSDNRNIEASIALKRVGNRIYQEDIDNIISINKKGDNKNVIYLFFKAEEYRKKLSSVGINIQKDKNAESIFEDSKEKYSKELLQKINNTIANEKFKESEILLNELVSLNPENQDYQDMKAMSYSEPIYREGLKNMEMNNYREAFYNFDKIINYKDSRDLRKLSQEKAIFKIAIIPIRNNTSRIELTDKLYSNIFKSILDIKDPFLQLLDQNQVRSVLNEKGIDLSDFNINNSKFFNKMGNIFDVDAFLRVTITDVNYRRENPLSKVKEAYDVHFENRKNPKTRRIESVPVYKKVYYTEYKGSSEVMITSNYSLLSKEAKVLVSDVLVKNAVSRVNYAEYDGDYRSLSINPENNFSISFDLDDNTVKKYNSNDGENNFKLLFGAGKEIKSSIVLENEVIFTISKEIANKLKNYNPEK